MPEPLAIRAWFDVAIGQSTLATQRVKANLYHAGSGFTDSGSGRHLLHGPWWGCEPTRPNRAVRHPRLAGLWMTTIDRTDRLVLDFYRCAMPPASPDWKPGAVPGDDQIGRRAAASRSNRTLDAVFRKRGSGRTSMVLPVVLQ